MANSIHLCDTACCTLTFLVPWKNTFTSQWLPGNREQQGRRWGGHVVLDSQGGLLTGSSFLAEASQSFSSCSRAPLRRPFSQNHPKTPQSAPAFRRMKSKPRHSFEAATTRPSSSSLFRTSPEGEGTKRICDELAGGSPGARIVSTV